MKARSMTTSAFTHGIWCSARLQKTTCASCGATLFLFFCDCGCMVLVEPKASTWRLHACKPGLSRFSGRDAFAVGRLLERRVEEEELAVGQVDGRPLVPQFALPADAEAGWRNGRAAALEAGFSPRPL